MQEGEDLVEKLRNMEEPTAEMKRQIAGGQGGLFQMMQEAAQSQQEYDAVVAQYTNPDGTKKEGWMKAPNGQPTNLTERQWVQVRTPSFKKWFGDWEAAAEIASFNTRVREWVTPEILHSLQGMSHADISAKFGDELKPIAYIRKEYLPFLADGITDNRVYSGKAYFLDHAVNHHKEVSAPEYYNIQKIIDTADDVKLDNTKPGRKPSLLFIKNTGPVGCVVVSFEVRGNGKVVLHKSFFSKSKKRRFDKYPSVKISPEVGNSSISRTANAAPASRLSALGDSDSIGNFIPYVNLENVSKAVDTNGEPLMAFHGTRNSFDVFDEAKSNSSSQTGVPGGAFVFSDSPETASTYAGQWTTYGFDTPENEARWRQMRDAAEAAVKTKGKGKPTTEQWAEYRRLTREALDFMAAHNGPIDTHWSRGGNVMPVFLNVRNPLVVDAHGARWDQLKIDGVETSTNGLAESALQKGHDGLIVRNVVDVADRSEEAAPATTIFVFDRAQIKSATANTGAFDPANPNILFQFLGEQGAGALDRAENATRRLDNLGIARQMETAGKDAKAIKLATGWERGADGLWRFETDDSGVRLAREGDAEFAKRYPDYARFKELDERIYEKWEDVTEAEEAEYDQLREKFDKLIAEQRAQLEKGYSLPLQEVLEAPELFRAYPQLRFVKLAVRDDLGFGVNGVTARPNDGGPFTYIFINSSLWWRHPEQARSTLLHEVQHVIQGLEGFARGGSSKEFPKFKEIIHKLQENVDRWKKEAGIDDFVDKSMEDVLAGKKTLAQHFQDLGQFLEGSPYAEQIRTSQRYLEEFFDDYRKKYGSAETPEEIYFRLAGETEARNTARRRDLTYEERLNSLASETEDVAREDQIVLREGLEGGVAESRAYRSPIADPREFAEDVRNHPEKNARYAAIGSVTLGGEEYVIKLPDNAVRHNFKNHPDFTEWEKIVEVINDGESYGIAALSSTGDPGTAFRLVKDGKAYVVQATVRKTVEGNEVSIHNALTDSIKHSEEWKGRNRRTTFTPQSPGGSPGNPSPRRGAFSVLGEGGSREVNITDTRRGVNALYQTAYHGTPHRFDEFTLDHMREGEGGQAHGWGLYFAQSREISEDYRQRLTWNRNQPIIKANGKQLTDAEASKIIDADPTGGTMVKDGDFAGIRDDLVLTVRRERNNLAASQRAFEFFQREGAELDGKGAFSQELVNFIARMNREPNDLANFVINSYVIQGRDFNYPDLLKKLEKILQEKAKDLSNHEEALSILEKHGAESLTFEGEAPMKGQLFRVDIPENDVLLDEQKPFSEQPEAVQTALRQAVDEIGLDIGDEHSVSMIGRDIYKQLSKKLGGMEAASKWLNEHGVKGITYDGRRDGRCFVVFDDNAIQTLEAYYQSGRGGRETARGGYQPLEPQSIIGLFKNADTSTVIHETGHHWLEELRRAVDEGKAELPKEMWRKLQDAYKFDTLDDPEIWTNVHERFARDFEAYMREGRAPSWELQSVFAQFRNWLREIYRTVRGLLGEEQLSEDVRWVFDRLLATEEDLARSPRKTMEAKREGVRRKTAEEPAPEDAAFMEGRTGTERGPEEIPVDMRPAVEELPQSPSATAPSEREPLMPSPEGEGGPIGPDEVSGNSPVPSSVGGHAGPPLQRPSAEGKAETSAEGEGKQQPEVLMRDTGSGQPERQNVSQQQETLARDADTLYAQGGGGPPAPPGGGGQPQPLPADLNPENVVRLENIAADFSQVLNVPIRLGRMGRVKRSVLGFFRVKQNVIRVRYGL